MRLLPLLLFLFITTTLFSQRELKGEYGPEYSVFWGGTSFKFDGKRNFEITKSSCQYTDKGSGKYTINDSLLILEYDAHPADTPLYKSAVKYFGVPIDDSIEVTFTLVEIDSADHLPVDYNIYLNGEETENILIKNRKGRTAYFKLPASKLPCELLVYEGFEFAFVSITQLNNAEIALYIKNNTTDVSYYIRSGAIEKYKISNITRDSFCLQENGHSVTWCYKKR